MVDDEEVSLIWYTALDENGEGYIKPSNKDSPLTGVRGETSGLSAFSVKIFNNSGTVLHESYLSTIAPGLHLLKETIVSSLRLAQDTPTSPKSIVLGGELLPSSGGGTKKVIFFVIQIDLN